MIKRCIFLFLAINISSLYAILGGVGLQGIQDGFKVDEEIFIYEFSGESVSINREVIDEPLGLGGFIYLTVIPYIDFEAGLNFTTSQYSYDYQNTLTEEQGESPEMRFGKLSWYLSAQRPIFKFPTIRLFLGGGINGASYTKIVSAETFMEANIDTDKLEDLDYLKDKLTDSSTGGHIEFGGRFKPPIIPFSLNATARYYIIKDVVPGEDGYLSLSMGVAFAI